jgi:hypothetical protein
VLPGNSITRAPICIPARSVRLAPHSWHYAWNDVTAVAAVNAEIGVGREDDGSGKGFGHAHKASIGEAHRHVRVLLNELQHRLHVFTQIERNAQGLATKKCAQGGRPA